MIVSVGLPTCMEGMMYPVPFASAEDLVRIAQLAEETGYHSVWGNDHMTTQRYVRQEFDTPPNFWEPLMVYAYLAAKTTTLKFGTGMLITPMRRDIVVLAKQVATLDQFSNGRFMFGFGVGAYREEFEALNPTWEVHRGDLVEESIQALKNLFANRVASWNGHYYQYEDVEMYPKPLQDHLPIYVGGNNPNAYRRAALYGDGWLPAGMPVEQLASKVQHLNELLESEGRSFDEMDVAMQLIAYVGDNHEQAVTNFQQSQMYNHLVSLSKSTLKEQVGTKHEDVNLIGTPTDILEKIGRLHEAGVKHLCGTYFCASSVTELLDQMQRFAEDVVPYID